MRSMQPPVLAQWLLKHFCSGPNNDAVIGDLEERYRQGGSYFWYWRQALLAIAITFFQEIWSHNLLAIRAVLVGWLVKVICLFAVVRIYGFPSTRIFFEGLEVPLFAALLYVIAMMSSGCIVARTHQSHANAMVLLYIAVELVIVPLFVRGIFLNSWIFAFSRIIAAVFFHFGILNAVPVLPISALITVVSILTGAGFFTKSQGRDAHAFQPATR